MTRRKPAAPGISRARREEALSRQIKQLTGKRASLVSIGAPGRDITAIDARLTAARRERGELIAERQRTKARAAARRNAVVKDRFALLVERSSRLTEWHLRVGEALRDVDGPRSPASAGAVSGTAGDGSGKARIDHDGNGEAIERGEAHFGSIAVPGPAPRSGLERWGKGVRTVVSTGRGGERRNTPPPTFQPRNVKTPRRVSDGGAVAQLDHSRRAARLWTLFEAAAAEEVSPAAARAAIGVIRHNETCKAAVARLHGRESSARDRLQIAMIAGLQAVAKPLGFAA